MNLVCIGGGNGAAQVMVGMKQHASITGVIAVTDSGRSTGKIRVAANIPAPGDIRNALLALSEAPEDLKNLFQFRFRSEKMTDLDGMAFGNLFIAALAQMHGNFEKAVAETASFLKVNGRVLPVTLYNTHLCAELADGRVVCEELNVRAVEKPVIRRLFFKDQGVAVNPEAAAAIRAADLVTIGPGSLFTTVIACLLAEGMVEALKYCRGRIIYIANTTTQPGQTDGFS
ncbi:MAG: YvcK family protein, partial [bacterium]|nr:YvcK family protein [bacterium]